MIAEVRYLDNARERTESMLRKQTKSMLWQQIAKGDTPRSRGRHTVTIYGGEGEFSSETNEFEAAVNTDEGPKLLAGIVRNPACRGDIQSGSMPSWEAGLQQVDTAIKHAYDRFIPKTALTFIGNIWDSLERTNELAAARSRILLGKVDPPPLAELPTWYTEQKDALLAAEDDEIAANVVAVESVELLIRAITAAVGSDHALSADIETGPLGRVVLNWYIPSARLQWLVDAIDIPWPAVKVYEVFQPKHAGKPRVSRSRIFHNAFDAIESLLEAVRAD